MGFITGITKNNKLGRKEDRRGFYYYFRQRPALTDDDVSFPLFHILSRLTKNLDRRRPSFFLLFINNYYSFTWRHMLCMCN